MRCRWARFVLMGSLIAGFVGALAGSQARAQETRAQETRAAATTPARPTTPALPTLTQAATAPAAVAPAANGRHPLPMAGLPGLFQRVILKPGAKLFDSPDAAARSRPTPGFGVFYVYERAARGGEPWIEVGAALEGVTAGWVQGARAVDWKQTMVLAFNNPAGRERTMFFRDAATPKQLWLNLRDGAAQANQLRAQAVAGLGSQGAGAQGAGGQEGPVVALEPETFVDITRHFYLLPILSWEKVTNERDYMARLLEVASAPAQPQGPAPPDLDALRNYRGAVVFVVDTTVSMGPYIDRTKDMIRRVISRIRDTAVRDNFRFGLIAYRDHTGGDPRLEYITRMVSAPDLTEAPDALLDRLGKAEEARNSNADFDEDAVAGLKMALDDVRWDQFAGRFMILITDAGTRDAKDPLSATHRGIEDIRTLARSEAKQVAVYAIHLLTPEGRNNHARAARQYRALTEFKEGMDPLYYPIEGGSLSQFGSTVDALSDALLLQVANAVGRPIGGVLPAQTAQARRIAQQTELVGTAMRLSYLGRTRQQEAPEIVHSFVLDQDLDPTDPQPARKPLDVRILLTRNQLSDLANTIRTIQQAQAATRLSPDQFFQRVSSATAATTRDPSRMVAFQTLGGAFGDYLRGLPYDSAIMEYTQQEWSALGSGRRQEVINALDAKLRRYEDFNSEPSLWVSFDGGRDPGERMYPVPLDALP